MEKEESFYDKVYKTGGSSRMYKKHYTQSIYLPIWKKALELIQNVKQPDIIDIGCGVGQFANMLFHNGLYNYKGIDFSKEAIRLAREQNSDQMDKFEVDNAYSSKIYHQNYNIVILFEVLEHLQEDIDVLEKIRSGATIFFSVPNFNSESHVRWFTSEEDIKNRYGNYVQIDKIYPFRIGRENKIYLCHGTKK
ncbi:class I SAM-dependent methyltransferase [Cytobacillus sp. FJAT-53684]|uniref:Class I SAM-dependent methyltransferase n=1 Tax=Cytobacillus mangrovibacter TaxID=3299024 RepID=A0ABW6JVW6_9BACI